MRFPCPLYRSVIGLLLSVLLLGVAAMSPAAAMPVRQQPSLGATSVLSLPLTVPTSTAPLAQTVEVTPPVESPFTDVSPGRVFYDEISWLAANGISNGWTLKDGTKVFRPDERVLRDQMAAFMYRLAAEPEYTPPETSPFADVSPKHVFYKEISWLADQGISNGWSQADGTRIYGPGRPVLRDQMAAFMHRLAGEPAYTPPAASTFTDVREGQVFYEEISWLAETGISNGWSAPGGTRIFGPSRPVLRDQMAAFMYRLDQHQKPVQTLAVTGEPLIDGTAGVDYYDQLRATGGTGEFTWTATGLPGGLSLSADGIITGTPVSTGSSSLSVTVTDAAGATATATAALHVPTAVPEQCVDQGCADLTPATDTVEVPAAQITDVSRDATSGEITMVSLTGTTPQPGDILALHPTTEATTGATVRVESVTDGADGAAVATVTPVKLSEAYPQGLIHATTEDGAAGGMAAGEDFASAAATPTIENRNLTCDGSAKAEVSAARMVPANVTSTYHAVWGGPSVNPGTLQELQVSLGTDLEFQLVGSFSGSGECFLDGIKVTWPLPTGTPLTINVTLEPGASVFIDGAVGGTVTATVRCDAVVRYHQGKQQQTRGCQTRSTTVDTRAAATAEVGVTAKIDTAITVSDIVGAKGGLDTTLAYTYEPAKKPVHVALHTAGGSIKVCVICFWKWPELSLTLIEGDFFNAVVYHSTADPLNVTTTTMPSVQVGEPYWAALKSSGGVSPYEWTHRSGAMPPGLTMNKNGTITGTPTQPGPWPITVRITDSARPTSSAASATVVIDVTGGATEPLSVTTITLPSGATGQPYQAALAALGGAPPYTWSITSGSLPAGLSTSAVGEITGTPTTAGNSTFTARVVDSKGSTTSRSVTVSVQEQAERDPAYAYARFLDSDSAGSFMVKHDGTVWGWGDNRNVTLGSGASTPQGTPVQLPGLREITTVAAGYDMAYALRSDGTVWAWGRNYNGQLGNGTRQSSTAPVQVSGLTDVVEIAAGRESGYALKRDGTVWSWGGNYHGQLGTDSGFGSESRSLVPKRITTLSDVRAISAGSVSAYAVTGDGTAWSWGWSGYGQLGDGSFDDRGTPGPMPEITNATGIAAGWASAYILTSDGSVWAVGHNVGTLQEFHDAGADYRTPRLIESLSGVVEISAQDSTVYCLREDGTAWAWGFAPFSEHVYEEMTEEDFLPVRVPHLTQVASVHGGRASFAVEPDGSVWGWGYVGQHNAPASTEGRAYEPVRIRN